jgi:short-subunit dehydrogenase
MKSPAQVVVITGASAGIGRATAMAFAREGAHICLLARGVDRLEAAKREVEESGGRAITVQADVADPEAVEAAAVETEKTFGPIDIWINNAMASVFAPIKETSAAKHAVQGFCDSLWSELIHDGSRVRMTMVQMPAVNTPQFDWVKSRLPRKAQPVPPIYQPEVAANAVVWAAYHGGREVWVGAPVVKAIVGDRIAPGLLDHLLASRGYDTQQTDEPEDPKRPNNLWNPAPGDYGSHGRFDHLARRSSLEFWVARHKQILAGCAAVALGGATVWNRYGRRGKPAVQAL